VRTSQLWKVARTTDRIQSEIKKEKRKKRKTDGIKSPLSFQFDDLKSVISHPMAGACEKRGRKGGREVSIIYVL